ncbi:MAG TPA: tRNA uridine-5-carboxymethylaminomethyl(34) synthesis GTPase MnmE [Candidatus Wallbacteria bacterium]|nr:tRNA uridine-5-carboxymethylaminomethyl(34) synthesis GTPase MnmE [Candidatus Wallbacteria bacterium]
MLLDDTIVAPSTPVNVPSAIGVIRISGADTEKVLLKTVFFKDGAPVSATGAIKSGMMRHAFILEDGDADRILDEVMFCFYKGPRSYTGEDMGEIFCHGGSYNMQRVITAIMENGARYAEPGEFTRRACINGKMDICQAEAILDVIGSKAKAFHDIAISQVRGSLSFEISNIKHLLIDDLSEIEANLDFPEDDVEAVDMKKLLKNIIIARSRCESLLKTHEYGKVIRNGLRAVITGCPNTGKSSLFNLLLREDRAIVTEIPGTTRDTLEETVNITGVPFTLIDTAGIRDAQDEIEKIGMRRANNEIEKADIVIAMFDTSRSINDEDLDVLKGSAGRPRIIVLNKIDDSSEEFNIRPYLLDGEEPVKISVKENILIDELKKAILQKSGTLNINEEYSKNVITNARHASALKKAISSLDDAISTINAGAPVDLLTIDIRAALSSLGEIAGETLTDDILHKIFEKFCIGK